MKKYKIGDEIIVRSDGDHYLLLRTLYYKYVCSCNHVAGDTDKSTLQHALKARETVFGTIEVLYPVLKKYKYCIHTNMNNPTTDFTIMIYGGKQ